MASAQVITLAGMLRARFLTHFKRLYIFADCLPTRRRAAKKNSSPVYLNLEVLASTQEPFGGACRHSACRITSIWWISEFWIFWLLTIRCPPGFWFFLKWGFPKKGGGVANPCFAPTNTPIFFFEKIRWHAAQFFSWCSKAPWRLVHVYAPYCMP